MLAKRAASVKPSGIRRIFELVAAMEDPIDLSIGQPHFDVSERVREAAISAIRDGFSRYTVTEGIPELNAWVRQQVLDQHGYSPEGSIITAGVSGGLLLAFLSLLDPDDEIMIPDPHFVMYRVLAEMLGAKPICYETDPDYRIHRARLDECLSPRTKVILVNSPANPTGHVMSEAELETVADFARENELTVISDEIYADFVYDQRHMSVAEHYENTILLNGFSKSLGMPGWRIGYAVGPEEILETMKTLQQFTFVCANTIAQKAVLGAIDQDDSAVVDLYRARRDQVVSALSGSYELVQPGGSFYAYPRLPGGINGERFVDEAAKRKLLVVPGSTFSSHDTHFRLSYGCEDDVLERGLKVLCEMAGEDFSFRKEE